MSGGLALKRCLHFRFDVKGDSHWADSLISATTFTVFAFVLQVNNTNVSTIPMW
jgi:hypothetical protein